MRPACTHGLYSAAMWRSAGGRSQDAQRLTRLDPQPGSVTAMTDDNASQADTLPTWTRLIDLDFGRTIRLTNSYKPFRHGDRIPVDPPGTVAIVRGSRTVEDEGGELVQEYVVQLERPANGVG
jgi:hypothetical protein